jgi:HEAT repeat protein
LYWQSLGKLLVSAQIQDLIMMLSSNTRQRRQAISQLIESGATVVEPLLKELSLNNDKDVQVSILRILSNIGDNRAIPVLAQKIYHPDFAVRSLANRALIQLGVVEPIRGAIKSQDAGILRTTAAALGQISETEDLSLLIPLLENPDSHVRQAAALALKSMNNLDAKKALSTKSSLQDNSMNWVTIQALVAQDRENLAESLKHILPDADAKLKISILSHLRMTRDEELRQLILGLLKDDDSSVRSRAALELGNCQYKPAHKDLLLALEDKSWEVRRHAAWSLGRLGNRESYDALFKTLGDKDKNVRGAAAEALSVLKDKRAVGVIIKLLDDKEEYVRNTAAKALRRLGAKEAIPQMLKSIEKYGGHRDISSALAELGGSDLIDVFVKMLESKRVSTISAGIYPFVYHFHDERAAKALIKLANHFDIEIRYWAVLALSKIDSAEANQMLLKLLEHKELRLRSIAVRVLGRMPREDAIKRLKDILAGNADSNLYESLVPVIQRIGRPEALQFLIALVKNENFSRRFVAVEALANYKDKEAVEALLWALSESQIKHVRVDTRAAWALGEMGIKEAVPALMAELLLAINTEDAEAITYISDALGKLADLKAVDLLLKALRTNNEHAKVSVIHALAKLGDKKASKRLSMLLADNLLNLSGEAVSALRKIGDETAVDGLIAYLKDAQRLSRIHAIEALSHVANSKATDILVKALYEKPYRIRKAATLGLRRVGRDALPAILAIDFKEEENLLALRRLIWLCGEIGDTRASSKLIAVVEESSDLLTRAHAVQALGKIGDPQSLDCLLKASHNNSSYIRAATATALGKLKDVDVKATLETLAKDSNENVRRAAKHSLENAGN